MGVVPERRLLRGAAAMRDAEVPTCPVKLCPWCDSPIGVLGPAWEHNRGQWRDGEKFRLFWRYQCLDHKGHHGRVWLPTDCPPTRDVQ